MADKEDKKNTEEPEEAVAKLSAETDAGEPESVNPGAAAEPEAEAAGKPEKAGEAAAPDLEAASGMEAKEEAKPEKEAKEAVPQEAEAEEAAPEEAKEAAPKKAPRRRRKKAATKKPVKAPAVKAVDPRKAGLSPDVFEVEPKVGVIHQVVRAEMAALRQGSASSKTRGEVRGGGVKPWRQKGTGRARAGSSRMPHWTGGGAAFGPKPRDYNLKVNRKVRGKALKMALSARVQDGGLLVVDELAFDEPKTAAAAAVLGGLDVSYPLLVLVEDDNDNAVMSFRNLEQVDVTVTSALDVTDVMAARMVLATQGAVAGLTSRLGGGK